MVAFYHCESYQQYVPSAHMRNSFYQISSVGLCMCPVILLNYTNSHNVAEYVGSLSAHRSNNQHQQT